MSFRSSSKPAKEKTPKPKKEKAPKAKKEPKVKTPKPKAEPKPRVKSVYQLDIYTLILLITWLILIAASVLAYLDIASYK